MIDWWQALVLSVAGALVGGFITLIVSYATHRWTTTAGRKAEERESKRRLGEEEREDLRRLGEEERQARRQDRRGRVQPIRGFVDVAKRYLASEVAKAAFDTLWERNVAGVKDVAPTLEQFRKGISEVPGVAGPDSYELGQAFSVAVATAPTPEILKQLGQVWSGVTAAKTGEDAGEQRGPITCLEQLVEDYVAKVSGAESRGPTKAAAPLQAPGGSARRSTRGGSATPQGAPTTPDFGVGRRQVDDGPET